MAKAIHTCVYERLVLQQFCIADHNQYYGTILGMAGGWGALFKRGKKISNFICTIMQINVHNPLSDRCNILCN